MKEIFDKLPILQKFITSLTWSNVSQFIILVFALLFAYGLYENRERIYRTVVPLPIKTSASSIDWTIPPLLKKEMEQHVATSSIIGSIQILSVDFKTNKRVLIYSFTDDKALLEAFEKYGKQYGEKPEILFFTNDAKNNTRMVRLINGEIVCSPYADTYPAQLLPATAPIVKTLCTVPIPPRPGEFSGMLAIYLLRVPNSYEMAQIRTLSGELSEKVHLSNLHNERNNQ